MNRLVWIGISGLVFVLALTIIFYFWGSSSNYDELQYNSIKEYSSHYNRFQSDTFSVVTYNIGYLSGMNNNISIRPDREFHDQNLLKAIEIIGKYHPAFIGFQEIDFFSNRSFFNNQMDSIAKYAGYNYGALVINWDKRYIPFPYWPPAVHFGRILSGQGLLSQFPITNNKRIVLPEPQTNPFYYNAFYLDRLVQISEIEFNGKTLVVMNVHLEAFDGPTREKQAGILKNYISEYVDDYPILLIGDFNSRPPFKGVDSNAENTIRLILNIPGMVTAITEDVYIEDPGRYLTFSSNKPFEKLDYIFYNPKYIEKVEAGIIHEAGTISDHLPVYMKFMLKNDMHLTENNVLPDNKN